MVDNLDCHADNTMRHVKMIQFGQIHFHEEMCGLELLKRFGEELKKINKRANVLRTQGKNLEANKNSKGRGDRKIWYKIPNRVTGINMTVSSIRWHSD